MLVGISSLPDVPRTLVEEYLAELAFLADTAGADVVSSIIQEKKTA